MIISAGIRKIGGKGINRAKREQFSSLIRALFSLSRPLYIQNFHKEEEGRKRGRDCD